MNKLMGAIALISMITPTYAMDISLSAPPGGNSGRAAIAMVDALKEAGISGDIKYNPNCAVVKNDIENNKTPMVFLNSAWGQLDPICKLNIDNKSVKLLDELFYYTSGVCYRKDKPNLGWNDFTSDRKKNIATSIVSEKPTQKILAKMKLDNNIKTIVVGSSGKTREVILGNEFDYVVVDADWVAKNTDKVDCLFIGTDKDQKLDGKNFLSLPQVLKDRFKTEPDASLQDVMVVFGANLSKEQEEDVRKKLKVIRANKKWQDYTTEFGKDTVTTADDKFNKITKTLSE